MTWEPYDLVETSRVGLYQSAEYDQIRERLDGLTGHLRKSPGTGVFEILLYRGDNYMGNITLAPNDWSLFLDFEPRRLDPAGKGDSA